MTTSPLTSSRKRVAALGFCLLLSLAQVTQPLFAQDPTASKGDATVRSASQDKVESNKVAQHKTGRAIYAAKCASCHGAKGEGVADRYQEPLVGTDSINDLAKLIHETMPEDEPEQCVDQQAREVAEYIYETFYSPQAQTRNQPALKLGRLTGPQLRQSLTDLYSSISGTAPREYKPGLIGHYYDGQRASKNKRKIDRVDKQLDFDFADKGPGQGIKAEDFSIQWSGALRADETGRYEIAIHSTCSFVCALGGYSREFINNHVQSGDRVDFRRSIVLTAGRPYPIRIRFNQRKRKTKQPPAEFRLSWTPPRGEQQLIPSRNLLAISAPASFSLQTKLPPDDRSYGFARGIAVNRQWDESTTEAALEFAEMANRELWPIYRRNHRNDPQKDRRPLRAFLTELATVAFRGPPSEDLRKIYIDGPVDKIEDDSAAIRRVLLMVLKSPRFLYPTLDAEQSPSQRAANRLALTLFDSLPSDGWLRNLAAQDNLRTEPQIRAAAVRMAADPRTRSKVRELASEWLNLSRFDEIQKDPERFPGFDKPLVYDLRESLHAFLEEMVWSDASDYRQMFLSKTAYTSPRIAKFYGDSWAAKDAHGQLQTIRREQQFGLLNHPYLMSGLAYPDSTSPIHRGVFLIRHMLGRTLLPPQEPFTPLSPDVHPDLTTRERVALQTSPKNCQVCHIKINGLGFTLEKFDAVGRYRVKESERDINDLGAYTTRSQRQIKLQGLEELAEFLANSDDAHLAFVNRAFQHFVKQPPAAFGQQTSERLLQSFRANQFNIRKLIIEIAVVAASREPNSKSPNSALTAETP